jgi:hypothetical protein
MDFESLDDQRCRRLHLQPPLFGFHADLNDGAKSKMISISGQVRYPNIHRKAETGFGSRRNGEEIRETRKDARLGS